MSHRRRRAAAVLAMLPLVALAGCSAGGEDDAPRSGAVTPAASTLQPCPEQPDRPAAGAELLPPLVFDCLGGGTLDLGRAPGVPTVVNLWASWCGPCREELPHVQQLAELAGDRLRVVGVISRDGEPQATSFAADAGATFPGAFDGQGDLMIELGLRGLPYTYLLDADGGIVHVQVGPVHSTDELRSLVTEHLGVPL